MAKKYRWGLMKVKSRPDGGDYLAFRDAELADRFIRAKQPQGVVVTTLSELPGDCYSDFSTSNLVVIGSTQELEMFLASPSSFPFAEVTYRYSSDTGELELAV